MTARRLIARRHVLAGMAALAVPTRTWADAGSPVCLSAGKTGAGFVLHGLGKGGESRFMLTLPARGHAAAAHPLRAQAVAFARRPGTFALVIDCTDGIVRHRLTPPEGRQFNGHGVFSEDGERLYTSEVVAEGSQGRIGVWDAQDYTRIGEWDSGGVGPHDIKRLGDGSLIVANGGIVTDPDDRTKLNLDTMVANLTHIAPDGTILSQETLPESLAQNSIRHLAHLGAGVAFAMQWEGDAAEAVPQLGLWAPGSALRLCPPAPQDAFAMQGYAGSIAVNAAKSRIALTSPKGGVLMIFDTAGAPVATHRRADLCGVVAGEDGFIATDCSGAVWAADDDRLTLLARHATRWDNHLVGLRTDPHA